jgi:hypothetical protein
MAEFYSGYMCVLRKILQRKRFIIFVVFLTLEVYTSIAYCNRCIKKRKDKMSNCCLNAGPLRRH